jgi:hypothetical protein
MERQAQAARFGALGRRVLLRRSVLQSLVITLIAWFVGPTPAASQEPEGDNRQSRSVAEDFLRLPVGPIAIGHHGVGPYHPAANPGLPIEKTVESVGQAYGLGARVVEVDVCSSPRMSGRCCTRIFLVTLHPCKYFPRPPRFRESLFPVGRTARVRA